MSKVESLAITASTVDEAWASVFNFLVERPTDEIVPLRISIRADGEGLQEDGRLIETLDPYLEAMNLTPTNTVANTIFPQTLQQLYRHDRKLFFENYLANYPWIRSQHVANRDGTYFGRLVSPVGRKVNGQLEYVISTYVQARAKNRGVVAMRLQAGVFDPQIDNKGARPGFPCLQQLSFVPKNGGLTVNGFYATQKVLAKAYGNYLGLFRLGRFMAAEMELELKSIELHVGLAHLGESRKALKGLEYEALKAAAGVIAPSHYQGGSDQA